MFLQIWPEFDFPFLSFGINYFTFCILASGTPAPAGGVGGFVPPPGAATPGNGPVLPGQLPPGLLPPNSKCTMF